MFTWISRAGLFLVLCGCVGEAGFGTVSRSVSILNGAVVLAPPRGYCVDRGASQASEDTAVMVIGRCSDAAGVPAAALTVSVGRAGSATVLAAGPDALGKYFASDAGRAALSRSGEAAAVSLKEFRAAGDVMTMYLSDRNVGDYWRAVMGVNGRLVTLAVTSPESQLLTSAQGKLLLDRAIASIGAANPAARS